MLIGVDEVGYGAWAGPVAVAAVGFKYYPKIPGIRDSKKISPKKRNLLAEELLNHDGIFYQYGFAWPENIIRSNLLRATQQAKLNCLIILSRQVAISKVYLDGCHKFTTGFTTEAIINGDDIIFEISCASIIAKYLRDKFMVSLAKLYPQYNWEHNVGYGTKIHANCIKRYGLSAWHRKYNYNL